MTGPARESEAAAHVAPEREKPRRDLGGRLLRAARVLGVGCGAVLFLYGAPLALDRVIFHGFSPSCSDGNPSYDPRYCGVTWRPGFFPLATAASGLLLLAISVWKRSVTGRLLVAAGGSTVLVALFLLWTGTWDPVTPAYPEPGAPQYAQLGVGATAAILGVALLRGRGEGADRPTDAVSRASSGTPRAARPARSRGRR